MTVVKHISGKSAFYTLDDKSVLKIDTSRKQINFYKTKELYGEFSNFARYPVVIDNILLPTTEHYYQSQKIDNRWYNLSNGWDIVKVENE